MRLLACLLAALFLIGCGKPADNPSATSKATTKELIVVTHNGPATLYLNGEDQYAGFEHDLAQMFARDLGPEYSIKFLVVDNISQVVPALVKGRAHFAAADPRVCLASETGDA